MQRSALKGTLCLASRAGWCEIHAERAAHARTPTVGTYEHQPCIVASNVVVWSDSLNKTFKLFVFQVRSIWIAPSPWYILLQGHRVLSRGQVLQYRRLQSPTLIVCSHLANSFGFITPCLQTSQSVLFQRSLLAHLVQADTQRDTSNSILKMLSYGVTVALPFNDRASQ